MRSSVWTHRRWNYQHSKKYGMCYVFVSSRRGVPSPHSFCMDWATQFQSMWFPWPSPLQKFHPMVPSTQFQNGEFMVGNSSLECVQQTNPGGNSILVCDSSAKEREPCSVNPLWTWTWPHSRRIYDGDQPHCWWTAGPINVVAILTGWVRGDHFMEANKIHGPCNQFILMGMTINFIFCQGLPGTCLYKNIKK